MAEQQRRPETISVTEGPELGRTSQPAVPAKQLDSDYPLIDSDPHFTRVIKYARPSDYLAGTLFAASGPALMLWWEQISPSEVGRKGFAQTMRLSGGISAIAGFLLLYSRSQNRFYGFSENRREIDKDMREMTDRVKKGLPLYGASTLTEYMQGAASRQSRYSGVFLHVMPWFNFVHHSHHGVDTAKYYQNAERELEAERTGKAL
ncbi:NADH-ubiquinone oxidoreductase kDa subunit [Lecanosticta acicola]|uniref:NADH-ubiquinone oxidoreductase kDa subunit n=1 Tax=Lecanosticta acicola TaxID=111012 RepID=A0AAI8Z118_9PEZI|nr:NADH-ubiquinone oxidoreductase kDa subunit [Lecanosticta acicola]